MLPRLSTSCSAAAVAKSSRWWRRCRATAAPRDSHDAASLQATRVVCAAPQPPFQSEEHEQQQASVRFAWQPPACSSPTLLRLQRGVLFPSPTAAALSAHHRGFCATPALLEKERASAPRQRHHGSGNDRHSHKSSRPAQARHSRRSRRGARKTSRPPAPAREDEEENVVDGLPGQGFEDQGDASVLQRAETETIPDDDGTNSRGAAGAEQPARSPLPSHAAGGGAVPDAAPGWGLESVDAATGRTALEELYDRHLSKIHRILEQPLPPMPPDGSVDPDFFVGFASYSYQLRDQYRAVLARELQVPVAAVRLSIAWSGRFNVKKFNRVQKVCGVCLDRTALGTSVDHHHEADHGGSAARTAAGETSAARELPEKVQQRIADLIAAINTRKREDLLQVQFFQASPPLPEVEFALTRQEHRLTYHLHEWIRRNVLQRAVAVVVYGLPPPPPPSSSSAAPSSASTAAAPAQPSQRYDHWRARAVEVSAAQHREVEGRWLRLFHRREIVPAVVALTELATRLAAAVVRGEVVGVRCAAEAANTTTEERQQQQGEAVSEENAVLLSGPIGAVLRGIAAVADASNPPAEGSAGQTDEAEVDSVSACVQSGAAGGVARQAAGRAALESCKDVLLGPSQSPGDAANFTTADAEEQEALLQWVRLVFQALLLRETHSGGASASASHVPHDVTLPALFAHGAYAGSREEVTYLQHNRAAMDALLLHPHEVSFKKKFVSRMRSSHRRLTIEREAAPSYPESG